MGKDTQGFLRANSTDRRDSTRNRRRPLILPLLGAALALSACGLGPGSGESAGAGAATGTPASDPTGSPSQSPLASPSLRSADQCRAVVAGLSLEEQAGQLFMVAITNSSSPDAATVRVIADNKIGNVLLLGNTEAGVTDVRAFTDEIREGVPAVGPIETLIAVDQEGGQVQRLQGPGFDDIPHAVAQAELGPAALRDQAKGWAEQLRNAGVDVNLAPVGDVVPSDQTDTNAPVGQLRRGYGSDPDQVSESVTAYVEGMAAGGVGSSVKHFPGLGRVEGNPDFAADVTDEVTTRDDPGLAPFGAAVDAGTSMVMVSSATYTQIDPDNQGVFSTVILQEMIRNDLGFEGAIISDDLGVAENLASVPVSDRGLEFVRAGGDLVINADPAKANAMVDRVVEEMGADPSFAQQVEDSATRVVILKNDLGRADCS